MMKYLPNLLTLIRIACLYPIITGLLTGHYQWALGFFIFASVTDGLDGYLARRYAWTSYLGSIIDPLADKALMLTCFITLYWLGIFPLWFTTLVLARDAIIIAGVIAYYFCLGPYEFAPLLISKLNTLLQIMLITLAIINLAYDIVPDAAMTVGMWLVATTTAISCVEYVWIWGWRALTNWAS